MASKQLAGDGSLIWQDDPDPVRPLSGTGASRQTRRMQLRNAGFRGPTMPGRKVSPTSLSSGNRSNVSGGHPQSSDAENQSPSGTRASFSIGKRAGSGVLTEIGNSTLTRTRKHAHIRPRVTSAKFYSNVESRKSGEYDAAFPVEQSSPPPTNNPPGPAKNGPKPRSAKVKGKLGAKRRSVSGETKHYIDHLEAELASAQTQLSAVTSPSVTRQQTSVMRSLNAETRQLQEALEEWENRYDERVQEVVDQYSAVEVSLRTQLRSFEEQREEDQYRIHELEQQVENMSQSMDSAEAANVHLERRLEILSDLLATSAKIDLHAETPGMNRRLSRPTSMHPRFPTTGNLMISPERLSEVGTHPPSPALSFASSSYSHLDLRQTRSHQDFISGSNSQSGHVSDSESVFSDAPYMSESLTMAEPSLPIQNTQFDMRPPSIPPRGRPTRRMRRFGAGSNGPRPLILPSASHYDHVPASAPPFELREASPGFPFRNRSMSCRNGSPLEGRRRASTMMDRITTARLTGSTMLTVPGTGGSDQSMLSSNSPASGNSQASTTKDFSSLGSSAGAAVSRNLMEELSQIRSFDGTEASNDDCDSMSENQDLDDTELQESFTEALEPIPESHSREVSETTTSTATVMGLQPCTSTASSSRSDSLIDRLRRLFSNLWHSPVQLARHLIQNAQLRMRLPAPLRNVQWWLFSVLLGPMAKRRLLSTHRHHSHSCSSRGDGAYQDDRQRLLISPETRSQSRSSGSSRSEEEDEDLAYGTFRPTTPNTTSHTTDLNSPSKPSSPRPSMAGPGKKRARNADGSLVVRTSSSSSSPIQHHRQERGKQRDRRERQRHGNFARHSPWLWLKFSITLAFAIGCAFKSGPGSLLAGGNGAGEVADCGVCAGCQTNRRALKRENKIESASVGGARRDQRVVEPL